MTATFTPPGLIPASPELERAFIGACLLAQTPDILGDSLRLVDADLFFRPFWRACWAVISEAWASGEAVDAVMVGYRVALRSNKPEDRCIGQTIGALENSVSAYYAPHYAKELKQLAIRRALIRVGVDTVQKAHEGAADAESLVAYTLAIAEQLDGLAAREETGAIADIAASVEARIASGDSGAMATGIRHYDLWTGGGLRRGECHVVGGGTGVGKTWVATQAANALADAGYRVIIFSLEMSPEDVFTRLCANRMGIAAMALRGHGIADPDAEAMYTYTRDRLAKLDLRVMASQRSMAEIAATVRHYKPDAFVVDYLTLMDWPPKIVDEQKAISYNAKHLQALAARSGACAMVLTQMSRAALMAGKSGKVIGGLGSGAVDHIADFWLLLEKSDDGRALELIVRKARHAPDTGVAHYRLDHHTLRLAPVELAIGARNGVAV